MKRILVLFLLTALLLGCRPTPETDYVVPKTDRVLLETIAEGDGFSVGVFRAALPEHWTEETEQPGGKSKLFIDAAVVFPEADRLPVLELAAAGVDPEAAEKLIDCMFPGASFVRVPLDEWGQAARTRGEITAEIEANNDRIERANELYAGESDREIAEYRAALEESNAALMRELEAAPEGTAEPVTAETLRAENMQGEVGVVDRNGVRFADATFIFDPDGRQREQFHFRCLGALDGAPLDSPEEALRLAEAYLDAIGHGDDYAARVTVDSRYYFGVTCTRAVGGVPCIIDCAEDWNGAWDTFEPMESLSVTFRRDNGMPESLSWIGVGRIARTAAENTALLPFDAVQTQIRNGLTFLFAWTNENVDARVVTVREVRLGYRRIKVPNERARLLVPAWAVIGSVTDSGVSIDADTGARDAFHDVVYDGTLLVLNAIDGTNLGRAAVD